MLRAFERAHGDMARDSFGRLDLDRVAGVLDVAVRRHPDQPRGVDGRLSGANQRAGQMDLFGGGHVADIWAKGGRGRFTLAHEIAHLLLREHDGGASDLSPSQREALADAIAADLLVPPRAVLTALGSERAPDVAAVEALAHDLDISITTFVSGLHRTVGLESFDLENVILVVDRALSRVHGEALEPRVRARATPARWFVPLNKRLSSLGATTLSGAFSAATLYQETACWDRLSVWDRPQRSNVPVEVRATYKLYATGGDERIMLAVLTEV